MPDPRQIACTACGIVFGEYERNQLKLLNEQKEALVTEAAAHALKRLLGWIALGFALLGSLAGIGLYQIYNGLRTLISDRIAAQFDEPRIKETLNQVARTRASEIIEEEVRPSIETARQDTKEALQSFENFLTDTRARLDTVSKEIQFSGIMARASNDDRKAFDELVAVANTPEHPFHDLAIQTVQTLVVNANLNIRVDPIIPLEARS